MPNWRWWRNLFNFKARAPRQEGPKRNIFEPTFDMIKSYQTLLKIYEENAVLYQESIELCREFIGVLIENNAKQIGGLKADIDSIIKKAIFDRLDYASRLDRVGLIKDEIDDPEALTALDECFLEYLTVMW